MSLRHRLEEEDYRGERYANHHKELKGNNDLLVITKPQVQCCLTQQPSSAASHGLCLCSCSRSPGPSVMQHSHQCAVHLV